MIRDWFDGFGLPKFGDFTHYVWWEVLDQGTENGPSSANRKQGLRSRCSIDFYTLNVLRHPESAPWSRVGRRISAPGTRARGFWAAAGSENCPAQSSRALATRLASYLERLARPYGATFCGS